jgi:hypothetical protein
MMTFLAVFYVNLVDMENFYEENVSTEATSSIFIISSYTGTIEENITQRYENFNTWLLDLYLSMYTLLFTTLNPFVWV